MRAATLGVIVALGLSVVPFVGGAEEGKVRTGDVTYLVTGYRPAEQLVVVGEGQNAVRYRLSPEASASLQQQLSALPPAQREQFDASLVFGKDRQLGQPVITAITVNQF